MKLMTIAIAAALVNNVVLSQFLGICSFVGVSGKKKTATGMGLALTFVLTISSLICGILYQFVLAPLGITYLKTIVFILVVATLVQLVEMFLKKFVKSLYQALGIYLPLITTNCAVLGVALLNVQKDYDILTGTIYGLATALGYWAAIVILSHIRENRDYDDAPEAFKGFPLVMLMVALMSIAFFGFSAFT